MSYNAGRISENTLQAMEIVAQSVVDKTETTLTKDCVIIEIVDSATGTYLVSSGYSSFTAYSLNKTVYKKGDLVYVQMPNAQNDGDKIILGRRQTGNDVYEIADTFTDVVFFNGRDNSLINLKDKDIGLIANDTDQRSIYLGTWTGEYGGVTKIGLEVNFITILKVFGTIEGTYGVKLKVTNNVGAITEFDFPCGEYYGNPYNYIYSTRINKVFTLTTQQTITNIEAYVYQNCDFYNNDEIAIPIAPSSNILLTNIYVGMGKNTNEILDSKFTIKPISGTSIYQKSGDDELIEKFTNFLQTLCNEYVNANIDVIKAALAPDKLFKLFSSTQIARINLWLEKNNIINNLHEGNVKYEEWITLAQTSVLRELSIEYPQISFSLVINTESVPEYLTAAPKFDMATEAGRQARSRFIRWYKRNRSVVIDDITLPDELHAGWELIGQFGVNQDKLNPLTEEGNLLFTPNYDINDETLIALIYYKNKYYMSNELTLVNKNNAKDQYVEDVKKDLIDQVEKDKGLIDANKRALNALVIESGYYETINTETRFINNNGLFYYYTRSGLIRENEKLRNYNLRCYSNSKDMEITKIEWVFPTNSAMVRKSGDASSKDGYYSQSILLERKYSPGKTNNIIKIRAVCNVKNGDTVQSNVIIENNIELLFGYYSCEGAEHSITAYWENIKTHKIVNCLVPGNEYQPRLQLDGQLVSGATWVGIPGNGATYIPSVGDLTLVKGTVKIEEGLTLGCWLGAKISYNEDNIIEGLTELVYQSDGTTHMRDSAAEADVSPRYRLELLLENKGNQQYADGIWWDPYSNNQLSKEEIVARIKDAANPQQGNQVLAPGWLFDASGEPSGYFSGPSNWSITILDTNGSRREIFMRSKEDLENYDKWTQATTVSCDYFSLAYIPQSYDTSLVRSTVEFIPKPDYLQDMANYTFGINIYTHTGYLLATIPLRISQNRYPSIYIDKMADSNTIVIDEANKTIFSPRMLAGKYEPNSDLSGQKVFTGVALGDFIDPETEAAMQEPGVYGFQQGHQAYAFKSDGTGFIGLNDKSKIKFNQSGDIPLSIGSNTFTVDTKGDISLTGSVKGNGYELNNNGSGFIGQGKSAIHFEPTNGYPLYIGSNSNSSNFTVDSYGNINLSGNIIFTNKQSAADQLSDYISIPSLDLSGYLKTNEFGEKLQAQIDTTQGLMWDGEQKKLTINAQNINGALIQGITINAENIVAGNIDATSVGINGPLKVYNLRDGKLALHGELGAGHGLGLNNAMTYGVGITAGSLGLNNVDSWAYGTKGGYCLFTDEGARIGYRKYYDMNICHNRLAITSTGITIRLEDQYNSKSHTFTFNTDGELWIDSKKVKWTFE